MNGIDKTENTTPEQTKIDVGKDKKLRKACADFEALLTYHMLKTMRRTIPSGGAIPRSSSHDVYESMMDQHIADTISRKGQGVGLQKILYEQLSKKQHKNGSSSSADASINNVETPAKDK